MDPLFRLKSSCFKKFCELIFTAILYVISDIERERERKRYRKKEGEKERELEREREREKERERGGDFPSVIKNIMKMLKIFFLTLPTEG